MIDFVNDQLIIGVTAGASSLLEMSNVSMTFLCATIGFLDVWSLTLPRGRVLIRRFNSSHCFVNYDREQIMVGISNPALHQMRSSTILEKLVE